MASAKIPGKELILRVQDLIQSVLSLYSKEPKQLYALHDLRAFNAKQLQTVLTNLLQTLVSLLERHRFEYDPNQQVGPMALPPEANVEYMNPFQIKMILTSLIHQINLILLELVKLGMEIPEFFYVFCSNVVRLQLFDVLADKVQRCKAFADQYKTADEQLRQFQHQVEQMNANERQYRATMDAKDRELAQMHKDLAKSMRVKEGLVEQMGVIHNQYLESTTQLETCQSQIKQYASTFRKQDAQINELDRTLEKQDAQINQLDRTLEKRDAHINELDRTLEKRDAHINELARTLEERDVSINKLGRERGMDIESEVQKRIKEKYAELEDLRMQLHAQTRMLELERQSATQLRTQIEHERQSVTQLRTQIDQEKSVAMQHERQRLVCQESLNTKDKELSAMRHELTDMHTRLEQYVAAKPLFRAVSTGLADRVPTGFTPLSRTPGRVETPLAQPGELSDVEYFSRGQKKSKRGKKLK